MNNESLWKIGRKFIWDTISAFVWRTEESHVSQDNWCPDQDLSPGSSEYETEELITLESCRTGFCWNSDED
jgi:hypothetical protein